MHLYTLIGSVSTTSAKKDVTVVRSSLDPSNINGLATMILSLLRVDWLPDISLKRLVICCVQTITFTLLHFIERNDGPANQILHVEPIAPVIIQNLHERRVFVTFFDLADESMFHIAIGLAQNGHSCFCVFHLNCLLVSVCWLLRQRTR